MRQFELIATATFGLEAIVKREIEALGYEITDSRNGRLTYMGDLRAIVRSNLWLRCADRVYVKMGEFTAKTFEELFQAAKGLPWEEWLPENAHFSVSGSSARSRLHSVPACQSIIEKAIVSRLSSVYGIDHFAKNGPVYAVRFMAQKDEFVLMINTSGPGLHDRGYRVKDVPAPIKETMAAALVSLSFFKAGRPASVEANQPAVLNRQIESAAKQPAALEKQGDTSAKQTAIPGRFLVDPFCGSGTIAIEAAMIARNIAPGLSRRFDCTFWQQIPEALWKEEKAAAYRAMKPDAEFAILASDIDDRAIKSAKKNAEAAGVDDCIEFKVRDVKNIENMVQEAGDEIRSGSLDSKSDCPVVDLEHGIVIANPPYGIRIGEAEKLPEIYESLRIFLKKSPKWSLFLITSDKSFETAMKRPADRRRKLYNGDLEVCYYQYYGEK